MKNNDEIIRLIQLYLSGELSAGEREELDRWCAADPQNKAFLNMLAREDVFAREFPHYQKINEVKAVRRFEKTIGHRRHMLRLVMKYAAILAFPLMAVVLWPREQPQQPAGVTTAAIRPGSSKAVLTLAGGEQVPLTGQEKQQIRLFDGIRLKQDKGLLVYDGAGEMTGRQEYNTLSTGRGGEYRLVLADGTKVFLNAATTLKYPVAFRGDTRRVQLEGEAYFEVAKDAAHAFVVETEGMEVKVYGTSFNVNTLRMDAVQTVLVEGSIGVRAAGDDREYRLHPGQMAVMDRKESSIELQEVDVELYTAWKDGVFRFNEERLEDLLTMLSNWYDVVVFYQNQDIRELHFSGYMERYDQITTILEAITEATGVRFSVQGSTIIVSE